MEMNMTELELQELSKAVAAKYGIEAWESLYTFSRVSGDYYDNTVWLHNDSGRLIDLCDEHRIWVEPNYSNASCRAYYRGIESFPVTLLCSVDYVDHNNDKKLAARVARMKALLAKGE